jgi:hypothetical protein
MKGARLPLILAQFALVAALPSAGHAFAAPDPDDDRIICKKDAKTGTRFQRRLCATKAQWEKMTEQQKRDYSEMRDRPQIEIGR